MYHSGEIQATYQTKHIHSGFRLVEWPLKVLRSSGWSGLTLLPCIPKLGLSPKIMLELASFCFATFMGYPRLTVFLGSPWRVVHSSPRSTGPLATIGQRVLRFLHSVGKEWSLWQAEKEIIRVWAEMMTPLYMECLELTHSILSDHRSTLLWGSCSQSVVPIARQLKVCLFQCFLLSSRSCLGRLSQDLVAISIRSIRALGH
jgi:hypothetical protein